MMMKKKKTTSIVNKTLVKKCRKLAEQSFQFFVCSIYAKIEQQTNFSGYFI